MATIPSSPTRRQVTKGAAWAAPAIMAAVAAPAASASTLPSCPTCFSTGSVGAFTSQAIVVGGKGTLAFTSAFNINAMGCDLSLFAPTYTILTTSATLTMSNGQTYTQTINLGAGQGTLGAISAVWENLIFTGISFPNGGSILSGYSVVPKSICISFVFILEGLPFLLKVECPQTLCWNINSTATGVVVGGLGTLNFTGAFSA
ncbi:hypothetical protein SAMN04487917_10531 [Arthrobacter sp. yr096]|uniref:hypothetical protein n=1 Tax=Arthrobacter sp. yr096 TaxID=1761750 RepID=UPI0008D7C2C6|nr:hypothetical protein [Arthrobacter sp. yr096]SEJ32664.1 hypothetical protein SAMN04487917_10531 [Arthrobacter sp. yr096]